MCTAEEKFFTPLTASEYRLLDVLCTLSKEGLIETKMEDLARFAQCSEESIRRALRGLETANLVETIRTKRNLGKLSYNRYRLVSPSHKIVGLTVEPPHKNVELPSHKIVGSTAGTSNTSNYLKVNKTTSYLVPSGTKGNRRSFILVNRWQEDEGVGGFGLFEDELAAKTSGPSISKRNPKTRNQRPQHEWTAADVASEFSSRIYRTIPGVPNIMNTDKLRGALSKMRKDYDSNSLIELEIMKMFFEDPWLQREGVDKPEFIVGRFLKSFASHYDQALRNLGLPARNTPTENDLLSASASDFVYASDGRRFDNSMPGQLALDKYEDKLRRKNVV
jgi:hypothetical protein